MTEQLDRRVQAMRERAMIRAWEYRQRNLSHGVWFRFRRVLTDAAQAFMIDDTDADALEAEGYEHASVGDELHPRKRIFFVSRARADALTTRREIPVRLHAEMLASRNLVLIPHDVIGDAILTHYR